jgi:farnesyl diphosphate synthase
MLNSSFYWSPFCYQIGTDIEDFKCSWLVVKALELSSKEQKKVLYVIARIFFITICFLINIGINLLIYYVRFQENYGKSDPANVAIVKALYKELDLQV